MRPIILSRVLCLLTALTTEVTSLGTAAFGRRLSTHHSTSAAVRSTKPAALSMATIEEEGPLQTFRRVASAAALSTALIVGQSALFGVPAAFAERVGEIPASGFIFKDPLDLTSFADPKVSGVTLYVSDFSKPITERLQGDFFSDPSTASITCVVDGPVKMNDNIYKGKEGEEVFSEAKSLLFKSVKVRRIFDPNTSNLIYVSYSQKIVSNDDNNKSRFKSSLCAVHATD